MKRIWRHLGLSSFLIHIHQPLGSLESCDDDGNGERKEKNERNQGKYSKDTSDVNCRGETSYEYGTGGITSVTTNVWCRPLYTQCTLWLSMPPTSFAVHTF